LAIDNKSFGSRQENAMRYKFSKAIATREAKKAFLRNGGKSIDFEEAFQGVYDSEEAFAEEYSKTRDIDPEGSFEQFASYIFTSLEVFYSCGLRFEGFPGTKTAVFMA
jgi:hypothetical protein